MVKQLIVCWWLCYTVFFFLATWVSNKSFWKKEKKNYLEKQQQLSERRTVEKCCTKNSER